ERGPGPNQFPPSPFAPACTDYRTSLRSIAPLPLTGFAVAIAVHLRVGTVPEEVLRFSAGSHLRAMGSPVALEATDGRIGGRRAVALLDPGAIFDRNRRCAGGRHRCSFRLGFNLMRLVLVVCEQGAAAQHEEPEKILDLHAITLPVSTCASDRSTKRLPSIGFLVPSPG